MGRIIKDLQFLKARENHERLKQFYEGIASFSDFFSNKVPIISIPILNDREKNVTLAKNKNVAYRLSYWSNFQQLSRYTTQEDVQNIFVDITFYRDPNDEYYVDIQVKPKQDEVLSEDQVEESEFEDDPVLSYRDSLLQKIALLKSNQPIEVDLIFSTFGARKSKNAILEDEQGKKHVFYSSRGVYGVLQTNIRELASEFQDSFLIILLQVLKQKVLFLPYWEFKAAIDTSKLGWGTAPSNASRYSVVLHDDSSTWGGTRIQSKQYILDVADKPEEIIKEVELDDMGELPSDDVVTNRYWLVQFDPGTYDALSAGREQKYDYWRIRTSSEKAKPNVGNLHEGDKVAFWQSGTERGCIGIGTVTQGANRILMPDLYRKYYRKPDDFPSGTCECVTISYDIVVSSEEIISENNLRSQPSFQADNFGSFFASRQGTFFEISENGWNMLAGSVNAIAAAASKPESSQINGKKGEHTFKHKELLNKEFIDPGFLANARDLLLKKKQIVLFGPPGTSKTYVAQVLAQEIAGDKYELCQFHPSLGYEDFVEGIDVVPTEDKTHVLYTPRPRIFRQLCQSAASGDNVVLIIDEINRGDVSRIFGELIFGLEKAYRGREISTSLSDRLGTLRIPENLLIIGTMNSVDRSIAFVDYALRRRFFFVELLPSSSTLDQYLRANKADPAFVEALVFFFDTLNSAIRADSSRLGIHHQIGHTMFFEASFDDFKQAWEYTVFPLIEEYMNMAPDQIIEFLSSLKTTMSKDARGSMFVPLLDGSLVKYQVD